jgi:hypothetical protein
MVQRKTIRSVALDRKLDKWLSDSCAEEGLSCSQVLNRAVKKMREKNILW